MIQKNKKIIIILTMVIALVIFFQGQWSIFKPNKSDFSTTPRPLTAYNEAQKQGEPVFLEFYASW